MSLPVAGQCEALDVSCNSTVLTRAFENYYIWHTYSEISKRRDKFFCDFSSVFSLLRHTTLLT